jgi:uncharacterized protein GlcG (DUF336 family)
MYDRVVLDVEDALRLVDAALAEVADGSQQPIAVAVVDDMGDWVAFVRMDGVPMFHREYARRKAYTAALMRRDLQDFTEVRARTELSLADFGDPRFIGAAEGGISIRDANGNLLGGLGVSGATPEENERIARTAVANAPVPTAGGAA